MKVNFLKSGFWILAIALSLVSCREDTKKEEKEIVINPPITLVESSLIGQVVDENGNALEGVYMLNGNHSTETDENGVFLFTDVMMNEYGQLITAEEDGYFLGAKMVEPRVGSQNFTQFILMTKESIGTISSETGGNVSSAEGVQISFPANGIKDANDNIYSGTVQVYAKFLDPRADDLNGIMPGDLRAVNAESDFVQLETYGMIAVELEDPAGNALNLADDTEATIEIPLSTELAGIAPQTIPLWHFDEANGYWVEEGEATLSGDKYVGTVSHFSFWNCDYPYPLVQLSGNVVDGNGNGLSYLTVQATLTNGNSTGYAYTDDAGHYEGKVPQGEEMTISVYEWNCGNSIILYEATVGPFNVDTELGDIVVDVTTVSSIDITASLVDCDMVAVSNGYLKIELNGEKILPTDANGMVSGTYFTCDATSMDATGYNPDALKKSVTTTHDIDGVSEIDLGTITVCDLDITEFISYTLNDGTTGTTYFVAEPDCGIDSPTFVLQGSGLDSNFTSIYLEGETTGTYNPTYASFSDANNPNGNGPFCQGCPNFEVILTSVGAVGEPIIGEFSGTMDGNGTTFTVTGNFAAIRDY